RPAIAQPVATEHVLLRECPPDQRSNVCREIVRQLVEAAVCTDEQLYEAGLLEQGIRPAVPARNREAAERLKPARERRCLSVHEPRRGFVPELVRTLPGLRQPLACEVVEPALELFESRLPPSLA